MISDQQMIDAYEKHKNLKIAANELGLKWQSYYLSLRKLGVKVVGDKSRYGSETDRLAAKGEFLFKRLVPFAEDQNNLKFQSKVDFMVGPHSVDVKTSTLKRGLSAGKGRFAFSLKKQELVADFFVCFGLDRDRNVCLLIPGEVARKYQSISLSVATKGKWWDYEVEPEDLASFFKELAA